MKTSMTSDFSRVTFDVKEETWTKLKAIANREGIEMNELMRRAFSVIAAYDEQMIKGNIHLGFTRSDALLDVELTNILTPFKYGY